MHPATQNAFTSPLTGGLTFLGSVVAANSLSATFWLPQTVRTLVLLAPLPFLLLFVVAEVRFLRHAEAEERSLLHESAFFAAVITVSVLGLGELFAKLGARLWDPTEVWHWVVLLACLLGPRRARRHRT